MGPRPKPGARTFDSWPDRYDQWFASPTGTLVKRYESRVMLELLSPRSDELILDAGCGTGVFTQDILSFGPWVVGLDLSLPMLVRGCEKGDPRRFSPVAGDLLELPFVSDRFDKVVSMTALEFIANGQQAVDELFRVTKTGGTVVVSTLNSLSPWAARRQAKAKQGDSFFQQMIFRSPEELDRLAPVPGELRTAIHFQKTDDPARIPHIEAQGQKKGLWTGAFLAVAWVKA